MKRVIIENGCRFGRLTVLREVEPVYNGLRYFRMFECKCECGEIKIVPLIYLREGWTTSCGCFRKDRFRKITTKHGRSGSRLYEIWCNMKKRCYNKENPAYKYYGGRGVSVCNEWDSSFESFRDWAGSNGYKDDLTIDRINVNGNYTPENCRWVPKSEQAKNRRCVILYQGFCRSEWARKLGVKSNSLLYYMNKNNCDLEKAVRFYLIKELL